MGFECWPSPPSPEKGDHHGNQRGRGRAPPPLAPPSPRHFRLLTLAFIPTTATAHPIEFLPRQPRRTSGGPPVLHGFPPAPTSHRFSSSLPSGVTHQRHLNTFHYCKCLKQILDSTRFFGHQTRHQASFSRVFSRPVPTALPP